MLKRISRFAFKTKRCRLVAVLVILICLCVVLFGKLFVPSRLDLQEIDVDGWIVNPTVGCGGHFTGYGNEFAVLRHAHVAKMTRKFSIPCHGELAKYSFLFGKEGTVLQKWMEELELTPHTVKAPDTGGKVIETPTFAVMRIEAHNLYHTMCEWYNVFVVSKLLKFDPSKADILFMDDRPDGLLDATWDTLFGHVIRYTNLTNDNVYRYLIWNVIGYESPVNFHYLKTLPYVDEFYHFFIKSFGINSDHILNCDKLRVTIIWRRDYMSHPERKQDTGGLIHRKFQNERVILDIVKNLFQGHIIKDVILEEMSMKEQVELFSSTDLLIGMHGAGMAHTMFLPSHAAVFETFPNYWGFLQHFRAFSRWRKIKYLGWQNNDIKNEYPDFYTRIPPDVLQSHLIKLKNYLCPGL